MSSISSNVQNKIPNFDELDCFESFTPQFGQKFALSLISIPQLEQCMTRLLQSTYIDILFAFMSKLMNKVHVTNH